jgi:serine/threonine protein kinase
VSFFVLTIGIVGVCFDRFVRSRSNTKTKRSYSHGISSSSLPINFLRSAPTSARTHIICPRPPKQAHPQKRDRSDAMLSRSNSSVIFSPRRGYGVLAGVFGLKIDDVTETSKASEPVSKASKHEPRSQDQYTYAYTSDGIEVLQPQQKPRDLQLVAVESNNESPYSIISSRSRESGLSVRDVPERWGLVKADDSKVLPSFSKPPTLPQRRGRHIAPLNNAIYGESDNSIGTPLTHMQVADPPIRNDYSLVKEIGAGGEGQCSLLMRKRDSQLRVVKTVKRPHKYGGKPVEAVVLQGIFPNHHDNIIRLHNYEAFGQGSGVQYYFEYANGGDLYDLASRYSAHNTFIPELFIWKVFTQLASALEFLHRGFDRHYGDPKRQGVVHRDIKPENIFLRLSANERSYPDVLLADFGCATFEFATYDRKGTYAWQGPEIPRQTPKGDVYSVGAIIHYLIHLESPLADMPANMPPTRHNQAMWEVAPEARQPRTSIPELYSKELCEFMLVATNLDHNTRIGSTRLSKELNKFTEELLPKFSGSDDESHSFPLADWAFGSWDEAPRMAGESNTSYDLGNQQYFQMMDEWEAEKMAKIISNDI